MIAVCFPVHQALSRKRSTLKGRICPQDKQTVRRFFLELTSFQNGGQNKIDGVVPGNYIVPFKTNCNA